MVKGIYTVQLTCGYDNQVNVDGHTVSDETSEIVVKDLMAGGHRVGPVVPQCCSGECNSREHVIAPFLLVGDRRWRSGGDVTRYNHRVSL